MAMKAKPIAYETLQPDEVEKLPQRVRTSIGGTFVDGTEWVVIHSPWPSGDVIEQLDRLNQLIRARSEVPPQPGKGRDLDRVLAWLVGVGSGVEADLAVDNLELRRKYLDRTPTLTAEQVHRNSGLHSRNKSEPASRWKSEGKMFAIRIGRRDLYPAFQFEDGVPRPVMRDVLSALPEGITAWQKALWFASGNGWLDGDEPQRRLNDGLRVVEAARRLADPADG